MKSDEATMIRFSTMPCNVCAGMHESEYDVPPGGAGG